LCDISAAFSQFFRYSSLILNLTNCLLFYATTVIFSIKTAEVHEIWYNSVNAEYSKLLLSTLVDYSFCSLPIK
ncbi:MAG: hypothetical protein ACOYIB_08000, partial [Desulfosporosinus sp.]